MPYPRQLCIFTCTDHNTVKVSSNHTRMETIVGCMWPSSPQTALHQKPSCHHDLYSHMGSGVPLINPFPPMHSVSNPKLISERCKSQHLWWYRGASVSMAWMAYIDAEACVTIFEKPMLPSKAKSFPMSFLVISAEQCKTSFCMTSHSGAWYTKNWCDYSWETVTISVPSSQTTKMCN